MKVQNIIEESHQKVIKIIKKYKKLTSKLAEELLEKETLEGEELQKLLNKKK